MLTTAEKKGKLKPEHKGLATETMCRMNNIGNQFSEIDGITAMTDVTGFGLLGHLSEICEGSNLNAEVYFNQIKTLDGVEYYIEKGCVPGGTGRNFDSYGHKISPLTELQKAVLCDPQTSGGLLIAVKPEAEQEVFTVATNAGIKLIEVGKLCSNTERDYLITIL